jgi:hypothetical protein
VTVFHAKDVLSLVEYGACHSALPL